MLGVTQEAIEPPVVHLTDAAVGAFKSATQRYPGKDRNRYYRSFSIRYWGRTETAWRY